MYVRILGPLTVELDGRSLRLGGRREQSVLAALALRPGRVVSRQTLSEAVWGDEPPSTARTQIQSSISTLRRMFASIREGEVITTREAGYQLALQTTELDVAEFSWLVAQAKAADDPVTSRELLTAALSKWKGEALQGMDSDALRNAGQVLQDERLAAWEHRIRLDLDAGHHDGLVSELRALVAEHPLRERSYAFLAIALYRSNQQTDALDTLRRARAVLADQVGVDPGAELQEVERAILSQDPRIAAPDSRTGEISWLTGPSSTAVDSAAAVHPAVSPPAAAVQGADPVRDSAAVHETGVLRDSAAVEVFGAVHGSDAANHPGPVPDSDAGQQATGRSATIGTPHQLPRCAGDFIGRSEQIESTIKALGELAHRSDDHFSVPIVGIYGPGGVGKTTLALRVAHAAKADYPDGHLFVDLSSPEVEDRTTTVLARLLRALGVAGSAIPDDRDERSELYRSLTADRRILLVIDGVSHEDQVIPLLPGTSSCAVILAGRTRLPFLAGARWFGLEVLDPATSWEMLASMVDPARLAAEPESVAELIAFAGGLPLALRIAGARLASRPNWRIKELTRRMSNEIGRLDEFSHRGLELRSSIGSSYRSLPTRAQRLFRLCALTQAPDLPTWAAAALLDVPLGEAEEVLDKLVDVQLIDVIDHESGAVRYRFHDLIRVYARERLHATENVEEQRQALDRLFGAWLDMARRAHRAEYGGDFTILHSAAPAYRVGGLADDDPFVKHLVEHPMQWLEDERPTLVAAVRQAAAHDAADICWDLALTLVTLFEVRALYDDWAETAQLALQTSLRTGNRLGQAASHYSLGALAASRRHVEEAAGEFDAALELFRAEGHAHGEGLTLRLLASVQRSRGDTDVMLDTLDAALAKLVEVGDLVAQANVLRSRASWAIDVDDHEQAEQLLAAAWELCERAGYQRGTAQVESRMAELRLASGDPVAARVLLDRVLATVRRLGDRVGQAYAHFGLSRVQSASGSSAAAAASALAAVALASETGERIIEGRAEHLLATLDGAAGRSASARTHLDRAVMLFEGVGSTDLLADALIARAAIADAATAAGDLRRVDELLLGKIPERATALRRRLLQAHDEVRSADHRGVS